MAGFLSDIVMGAGRVKGTESRTVVDIITFIESDGWTGIDVAAADQFRVKRAHDHVLSTVVASTRGMETSQRVGSYRDL